MGGSADRHYNGSWIVQQSIEMGQPVVSGPSVFHFISSQHVVQIFASLNYRVSVFGFLYGDEVAAEKTGNFGLLDQVSYGCSTCS
jgi:acetylcholinesterase